jgi:hypothetical protein
VSSIPAQAIQHYLIKFVNDLRQVSGFLRVEQGKRNLAMRNKPFWPESYEGACESLMVQIALAIDVLV